MNDSDPALNAIARAAADLVPELTERLERHGLGEIEVARGNLRLRVANRSGAVASRLAGDPADEDHPTPVPSAAEVAAPSSVPVSSPAVGFFVYADGLGPGIAVAKGDSVGHVEMLGVRHDVRVPRGGTVRNLVAESGEAVEYGQVVVELEPAEAATR